MAVQKGMSALLRKWAGFIHRGIQSRGNASTIVYACDYAEQPDPFQHGRVCYSPCGRGDAAAGDVHMRGSDVHTVKAET
jgi:hypothetical protein